MIEANKNCYGDGYLYDKSGKVESACYCKKQLSSLDGLAEIVVGFDDLPFQITIKMLEHGLDLLSKKEMSDYFRNHWKVSFESYLKELRGLL